MTTEPRPHTTTHTSFDLNDPEFATHPFRVIERIRAAGGIVPGRFIDNSEALFVVEDEDVRTILEDRRFVTDPTNVPGDRIVDRREEMMRRTGVRPDLIPYLTDTILDKDGVDHIRLRKLVSRTFTVRRLTELRPRIRRAAEALPAALPEHRHRRARGGVGGGPQTLASVEQPTRRLRPLRPVPDQRRPVPCGRAHRTDDRPTPRSTPRRPPGSPGSRT